MQKDDLLKTKEGLEQEKLELQKQIRQHSQTPNFGNDVEGTDQSEKTDEVEELSNQLAIAQVFRERLNEVERNLKEINTKLLGS